jgi:adenylyl-sulfate kinase
VTTSSELLTLLYEAHRGVRAMTMEIRDWQRRDANYALIVQTGGDAGLRLRWLDGGPDAAPLVSERRLWFEAPDRVRVEVTHDGNLIRVAVRDGEAWWRWDPEEGEAVGSISETGGTLPPLLDSLQVDPARLLSSTWLDAIGTRQRASRDVVHVQGVPRFQHLPTGRRMEFDFDREHGTPLLVAAFDGEEPLSAAEVRHVVYGNEVDSEIFSFQLLRTERRAAATPTSRSYASPLGGQVAGKQVSASRPLLIDCRTVWLTGLPGAGKTTIARATERLLQQIGTPCCVLDGDDIREGLSKDLGLTRDDRGKQAVRVAHVAALLADSGVVPIVALVSPYSADRERARGIHTTRGVGFLEIFVDTPLSVCVERDPKGLYACVGSRVPREASSDGSGLTGISSPYESPVSPDLTVSGNDVSPRVAAKRILEALVTHVQSSRILSVES